jgi:hypothetical protein
MGWKNAPNKFSLNVLKDADTLTKRITGEMLQGVVVATPVDTGQARSNWRVSVGSVDGTTDTSTDKGGSGAIKRGIATIQSGGGLGKVVYISNSLRYIERLNNGWSMQAPKNFMQITFMNVVNKYR